MEVFGKTFLTLRQDSVRTTVDVEENNRVQMVVVFLLFT